MNINTFFLDKLLAGNQSLALGSKKPAMPINLFSDIIKVYEKEGEQNTAANESGPESNLTSQNILQLPVNVIECNSVKLQALSQFIDAFMADPQLSVKPTEIKHDLQSVVINKKQFLLSSENLENFIQGLIQNLGLNSDELKTAITQNAEDNSNAGAVKPDLSQILVGESGGKDKTSKEADIQTKTDNTVPGNGNTAQSLLQYLSENKSLSLSIINGKDKININFYTLPEENIENELNLEKLSADFNKSSKELNASFTNVAKEQVSVKTLTAAVAKSLEKNPADFNSLPAVQSNFNNTEVSTGNTVQAETAKPVDSIADSKPNENVYKTEVTEITFNPTVQSKKVEPSGSKSKIYQLPFSGKTDLVKSSSIMNSSPVKKEFELFDAGFRLRNDFAAQLSALQYSDKNSPTATSTFKTAVSNPKPLFVQQSIPPTNVVESGNNKTISTDIINALKTADNTSSINENASNNVKVLPNDLNGASKNSDSTISISLEKDNVLSVVNNFKNLLNDLKAASENSKLTIQASVKKDNIEEVKNLLADLNGKIENSGLINSSGQKDKITLSPQILEMKNEIQPVKADQTSKTQDVKTTVPDAAKLSKQTTAASDAIPFKDENSSGTIDASKAKPFAQEVKDVLVSGMVSQKITANDEKIKAGKDTEEVKSVSSENVKNDKAEVKEVNGKATDEKEFAQDKSNDNSKNVLQGADQAKIVDTEKFKIIPEAKPTNEPMRVIKPTEIIPEFTKIIQAGEKQSMTFQLTPENLGKVKLIVDLVNNHVNTRIEVESDQVKQFIQSNIEQLKQNLQSSGIHLSNVNVSLSESEQKFSKAFAPRKKMGEKVSKIKEGDDSTRQSKKTLGYNTYEYLA